MVFWLYVCFLDVGWLLWEFNVVEGLDNVFGILFGLYVLIIKVYYCVIDGVFGMEMIVVINSIFFDDDVEELECLWLFDCVLIVFELFVCVYVNNLC